MHLNIVSSCYPIICLIIINLIEITSLINYPLIVNLKVMYEPNHTLQYHTPPHPAINNSGDNLVKLTRLVFLSLVTADQLQSTVNSASNKNQIHRQKCSYKEMSNTSILLHLALQKIYPGLSTECSQKHQDDVYSSPIKTTLVFYVCHDISHHISCLAMLLQYYLKLCYYNVVTNPFIPFTSDMYNLWTAGCSG